MAKLKDGSTYLDHHLACNDYYAEGERVIGHWHGSLAPRLGIAQGQQIHGGDRSFRLLRDNINPATGEKLTQRNVATSIRFYDFQCSAQKSVSLLWALTGDERLKAAHALAATEAFAELETFAACRLRAGAAVRTQDTRRTGNLCAARFRHDASRALDPQLHDHFVVANATWDEVDGRMVALESCEMLKAIRYAGKTYQNALAREVRALGYDIEESRGEKGVIEGFEIRGVSRELRDRFSKRRAEVEAGISAFEQENERSPSRAEIAVITRQTRSDKMAEISTEAVRADQLAQLSQTEAKQLRALTDAARQRVGSARHEVEQLLVDGDNRVAEQAALQAAVAHLYERASVLRGHDVLAETLNTSLGRIDLKILKQSVQRGGAGLVALDGDEDLLSGRFATEEGLALERWSVGFVNRSIGRCRPLFNDGVNIADWLADEQQNAVRFVGGSRDRVVAIRGVAGAGKTTVLRELNRHLAAADHQLLYLAPTASAVDVLRKEGFANAMTVSAYLVRAKSGEMPDAWQDAVVVVDEAGLSSNQQGAALLQVAESANQRVVLVGDSRQHSSVDAGDFMRVLEYHSDIDTRVLKDIRRQTVTEYRQAIELLAHGQAAAGMEQIDQSGWIKEGGACYLEQAASEYLRLLEATSELNESVLCVAPTWAENHVVTTHIREGLRAKGKLGETRNISVLEPLGWTTQRRKVVGNYRTGQVITFNRRTSGGFAKNESREIERTEHGHLVFQGGEKLDAQQAASYDVARWREVELAVGDKILLRANRKKLGLINGNVLTVTGFGADGSIQTVEGKIIPADYRHFTHGYAVTSHKSQGRTTDHVVVAAERLDGKSAYVACSRGRTSCTVFTPDRERLFAGLPRSTDRVGALDVMREQKNMRQQKVARPNWNASLNGQPAATGKEERVISQLIQTPDGTNQTAIQHNEPKETDQKTHTYGDTIRDRAIRTIRTIAEILRTIAGAGREHDAGQRCLAQASREHDAGERCLARASRELDAGQSCLARASRSRRIGSRAIDRLRGRRSRGFATIRVELVQTIGGGLDNTRQHQDNPDQRQPDRMGDTRPDGRIERADGKDCFGSEPAEFREAQQSTPEVTATSDLPTNSPHDASQPARKTRMGGPRR